MVLFSYLYLFSSWYYLVIYIYLIMVLFSYLYLFSSWYYLVIYIYLVHGII